MNIRETIESTLSDNGYGQYVSYAQPVVAALEAREQGIADNLREQGAAAGFDSEQVATALYNAGLPDAVTVPEPTLYNEEAPAGGVDIASLNDALERALRPIRDQVERLTTAARSRGISV